MCLDTLHNEEEKKRFIQHQSFPLKAYKVMLKRHKELRNVYSNSHPFLFQEGTNVDLNPDNIKNIMHNSKKVKEYPSGFHAFSIKEGAQRLIDFIDQNLCYCLDDHEDLVIKQITINEPKHITAVGTEKLDVVIVSNQFEL